MRRKLLSLLICSSLVVTLISACGNKTEEVNTTQQTEKSESSSKDESKKKSEEEPSMSYFDELEVDKGMEVGETYTYSRLFAGIGTKDVTFTLDSVEFADADIEGYRSCTVSFTQDDNNQYTDADASTIIDKAFEGGEFSEFLSSCFFSVADGKSGLDIEGENNEYDVKFEVLNDENEKTTLQEGERAVYFSKKWAQTVKITYPKNYKDLCIGFGCKYNLENDPEGEGFMDGKIPFAESVYYTQDKINSRWVNLVTLDK